MYHHHTFTQILFFLFPILLFGQAGYYEYTDKDTKFLESFDIRNDGTFTYTQQGEWANTLVTGRWTFNINETITLNSDYQLDSLIVEESMNPENGERIYFTLTAPAYKEGPRNISAIILNENPSYGCQMMHDKVLADAEERNRILTSGRQVERDSAMKSFQPLYFECNTEGIDSLQSIQIEFDKRKVEYLPLNSLSTAFSIQFNLAPSQTYRYFKNEVYVVEKKGLVSKADEKYKKAKK
jgi:hypothetical protein